MSSKVIFGIDLGTTYSCIAMVDEHRMPIVLPNAESQPTTPSVVYFENESSVTVGETAKDATPLAPDLVASRFKRRMGDENWRFNAHGKDYRPQEISAHVLRKLAADAEVSGGHKVDEVVITCPAYFGVAQKEATRQAGELAGLTVRHVIPEPTAAAIAYGLRSGKTETVLVYDLGGGTFDITLIDIADTRLTVLTTGGDAELGGADWDAELARYIAGKVGETVGDSTDQVVGDPETFATLLLLAENAKRQLTNREATTQMVSYKGERVKVEVTRAEFENMTATLLERTITITRDAMRVAEEKGQPKPTRICLVGGSSYMPQVKKRLEAEFPGMEMQLEDPNQIVAKGAALFGMITALEDRVLELVEETTGKKGTESIDQIPAAERAEALKRAAGEMGLAPGRVDELVARKVTNVTSRGFAIKVLYGERTDPVASVLVHVDDPVPANTVREFGLATDNQRSAEIAVFETECRTREGDNPLELTECKLLGEGQIELDRGYPRGTPIEVTLGLSSDGTLEVNAVHKESGRECRLNMKVTGVMSEDELNAAKQHANSLRMN